MELEKLLQTWANKDTGITNGYFHVSYVHEDGTAVVIFKPASGIV